MTTMDAVVGLALPEHERPATRSESYAALLARLSHQSVVKHFDAYADVDWDAPAHRIDADDPCWELSADHPLGGTAWYHAQPARVRTRIGLHLVASQVKLGVEFERVLKQGLLDFASTLSDDAPEFRYVYHEVIEEAQHSLMFHELVQRTGLDVPGSAGSTASARGGWHASGGASRSSSSSSSSAARSRSTTPSV